jgi:hypothetical protein
MTPAPLGRPPAALPFMLAGIVASVSILPHGLPLSSFHPPRRRPRSYRGAIVELSRSYCGAIAELSWSCPGAALQLCRISPSVIASPDASGWRSLFIFMSQDQVSWENAL